MSWYKPWTWGDESSSSVDKRKDLNRQAGVASDFAAFGQAGYEGMSNEAQAARDALRDIASGKTSLSAEQLRQGLQQNLAMARGQAASASPGNAAMAARTAALTSARLGYGMSGQAATAGLAEQEAARKALMESILQQRQQDAQVALGSRGNAISAFGGVTPDKSALEKWGGAAASGLGYLATL